MGTSHIYLSLGYNCEPRVFISTVGGMSKSSGYLTGPFDLCFSSYKAVYNCIETDFTLFFENLVLVSGENADGERSLCGKGKQTIMNRYDILFNYESPTHSHLFKTGKYNDMFYVSNNFEEFKKRYSQRIHNFKRSIETHDSITFIANSFTLHELSRLETLLKNKYPDKKISVCDLWNLKIQKNCHHEIIDDVIDIDIERSQHIRYCSKCEKTF